MCGFIWCETKVFDLSIDLLSSHLLLVQAQWKGQMNERFSVGEKIGILPS